jgi:hypothetical protein
VARLDDELTYGRVHTHIHGWLNRLEQALRTKRIDGELRALAEDPVYQEISAERFKPLAPPAADIVSTLQRLREAAATTGYVGMNTHLKSISAFFDSHADGWTEDDYFTVPVMISRGDSGKKAGFVFLRPEPKLFSGRNGGVHFDSLTNDPALLSATRDYFGSLAAALMREFYFVHTYPFDWEENLGEYSYKLLFGCQITKGLSMGAAVIASFTVAFLSNVLGAEEFGKRIAPRRGTIITGEVQGSSIDEVDDIEEKILAAIEEFGPSIRVIYPAASKSKLTANVTSRIDPTHLVDVSSVRELLAAVLASGESDERGLYEARRRVFGKLTPPAIRKLQRFLEPGVDPDVFRIIAEGGRDWMTPQAKEGGIYITAKSWKRDVTIRLGLEPSAAEERPASTERELIELVLDGSARMDDLWRPADGRQISRVTDVVFEVASRIDPERQELVAICLSSGSFHQIEAGITADTLERLLSSMRAPVRARGPFFRPVYETSIKSFRTRTKRIFLLTDSLVPDWDDLPDYRVSSRVVLRFLPAIRASEIEAPTLFSDGKSLDKKLLRRYFDSTSGAISRLEICLGAELPVAWEPPTGQLALHDRQFVLRWDAAHDLKCAIRLSMAHQAPSTIEYRGEVNHVDGPIAFRFAEPLAASRLDPLDGPEQGSLEPVEADRWAAMCPPGAPLAERTVQLLASVPNSLKPRPVFTSLQRLRGGWLALRAGSPEWRFFTTGFRAEQHRIAFAVLNGALHYSTSPGHLEHVSASGDAYSVTDPTGVHWFLCRV